MLLLLTPILITSLVGTPKFISFVNKVDDVNDVDKNIMAPQAYRDFASLTVLQV